MKTKPLFSSGDAVREAGRAVLYGAGGVGRDACRVLLDRGIRVECLLDRNATGDADYFGVPIRTPERCVLDAAERARTPVVLSIFNRDVDIAPVARGMHELGFTQVVSYPELHSLFPEAFGDRFWLTTGAYLDWNATTPPGMMRLCLAPSLKSSVKRKCGVSSASTGCNADSCR